MVDTLDDKFADRVATLTYAKFSKLPKKGKPQKEKEWTLLSSIAMTVRGKGSNEPRLKIVALCTGTKCLGKSQLSKDGDVVSDSHAEVLSRRAFVRYLLGSMALVLSGGKSDVLEWHKETGRFALKPGVEFHLFSSHIPCGDSSIFPKDASLKRSVDDFADIGPAVKKAKTENEFSDCDTACGIISMKQESETHANDIYRTGAKCVPNGIQDPKAPGLDYHVTGVLRTKPGRGDPTCSMSCSDKIALWNVCGIQGALCSHLLEAPIYLSSIIIGKCPFDESALRRAVINRINRIDELPDGYCHSTPKLLQSSIAFEYSKSALQKEDRKIVPCPAAIIWNDLMGDAVDVCVNGRRQGITKKDIGKVHSRDCIEGKPTYLQCKKSSKLYQKAKSSLLLVFSGWIKKPEDLEMFVVK